MSMPEQLKSRKLWITILAGVFVSLAEQIGIQLDEAQLISLGLVVASYIGGQSVIDKQKVKSEAEAGIDKLKAEANSIIAGLVKALEEAQAPNQPEVPIGSQGQ